MAKKEQIATCLKVTVRKTKNGEKEVGTLELNGKEFDVWESDYFKPNPGDRFTPVIDVIPIGYHDKNGVARARMQAVVNWEAV